MKPETTVSQQLTSDGEETISTSSEDENECDGAVVLRDTPDEPSFGNISVVNSNDVHFGNKTFYHGPVTIKQILYGGAKDNQNKTDSEVVLDAATLANNGFDNPTFINDITPEKTSKVIKPATQESTARRFKTKGNWKSITMRHYKKNCSYGVGINYFNNTATTIT